MRLHFGDDRLLAVVAHPDDAELLCAGTLARARDEGAAIGVCVFCQGDKGQPTPPIENLAQMRREEMAAAADLLGAEPFFLGYGDGELFDGPEARARLIEVYRQFCPTLILAHAAEDYHADHRTAGALAESASWFCASSGHQTTSPPLDAPPSLWWMDTVNFAEFRAEIYIDVSQHLQLKQQMLRCHTSQLQRGGERNFSPLEEQMLSQCRARGAQAGVAAAEAFRLHRAWKRARAW